MREERPISKWSLMSLFTRLRLLVLISFGWVLTVSAQSCVYTLQGSVLDAHDLQPMENVSIFVHEIGREVWTNDKGQFEFMQLCRDEYHLLIQHVGCPSQRLLLSLGNDTAVTIFMEHHQNMLHEVDVHDQHDEELDDRRLGKIALDENGHKSLAAAIELVPGASMISNGSDIGLPILQGLSGNRVAIVNNGFVHMGQQWGADHSPEIDLNTTGELRVISGSGTIRYPGSHMGNLILLEPNPIPFDPHLHGKWTSVLESNGLGSSINAQIYKGLKHYQWRLGSTFKKMGDRSTPEYFLNNTGTQQNHLNAEFRRQWSSGAEWQLYYTYFGAEFGILRGSHIGNLSDLRDAFERPVPFYTDTIFSYHIESPRQSVNHHQLKSAVSLDLTSGKLEWNTAVQRNLRREFDVRRNGRSDQPALSLLQYNFQNELVWSTNRALEMGYQFSGKNNWNLPETGILPLLPNYTSFTNGIYFTKKHTRGPLKLETGARYDFQLRNVVRLTNSQPREVERFQDVYHNVAVLSRATMTLHKKWQLLGELAYKQRPPEINELYSFGLHQGVSGIEEGSIDLKQEKGLKGALHLRGLMGKDLHVDLNGYVHQFENYIFLQPQQDYRLTIRGAFPVFTYEQCDAILYGSDLKVSYMLSGRWKLESNWSYIYARNLTDALPLNFIPPLNGSNTVHYEISEWQNWRNLRLSMNHRYVAEQWNWDPRLDLVAPPPAYQLLNISFGGTFKGIKNEPQIRIGIENLANVKYRDYLNRQRYFADATGRNLTLSWLQHF
jgi:iron complex outermembrane recepter protein